MPRHIGGDSTMKKRTLQVIGGLIWSTSERLDVPLGQFAPIVFGWMIGSEGVKVNNTEESNGNG
jgi:hypothetical protein